MDFLAALLQQARRPSEAIAVFEQAAVADPPDYALLAATRAYRDVHRNRVRKAGAPGPQRFPDQTEWPLLLALVLTDAGRPKEALEILGRPETLERHLAEGYARRRAGDHKALSAYTDALKLAPANTEARTGAAALLQAQGGPYGAAALAGTTPPYAADQAAAMTRWGIDTRPLDPAQRFDRTDAAIARLDRLLAALRGGPPMPRHVVACGSTASWRFGIAFAWKVADEACALRSDGPLPAYAEEALCRRAALPAAAGGERRHYRRVLAGSPKMSRMRRGSWLPGLFYASVELEDFETAFATIDSLVDDEPIWRTFAMTPRATAIPTCLCRGDGCGGAAPTETSSPDAWARITRIADAAPANKWARLTLYQVAHARGWPRRAETEGEIAASLDPDSVGAKIALAEIAMANYRLLRRNAWLANCGAVPGGWQVRRLARELEANTGWVLGRGQPSNSHGGGANAAGRELTAQTRLTTSPIADNWRLFAIADYANAHPPGGFVDRSRIKRRA